MVRVVSCGRDQKNIYSLALYKVCQPLVKSMGSDAKLLRFTWYTKLQ